MPNLKMPCFYVLTIAIFFTAANANVHEQWDQEEHDEPSGPHEPQGSNRQRKSAEQQQQVDTNDCARTYVRWGRTTCPTNVGTELVYNGSAGGTPYSVSGGGANFLCMPDYPDYPDYLQYDDEIQGISYVYPVEYEGQGGQKFKTDVNYHNAPCAVCMTVCRCAVLMIPAKTQCPPNWTTEYVGYLASAAFGNSHPNSYVCVDKDPESVPHLNSHKVGAIFGQAEIWCSGVQCKTYVAGRELPCVVCSH